MARNKDASRGLSSRTQRKLRDEMALKTLNRKKNLIGTTANKKENS
jgi:hypothetical protein